MEMLVFGVACLALSCGLVFWDLKRRQRRKDSLRKEDDGAGGVVFVWNDAGVEKRSKTHPDEPDGAWHSDAGTVSDAGGGGGGDGGGGGG